MFSVHEHDVAECIERCLNEASESGTLEHPSVFTLTSASTGPVDADTSAGTGPVDADKHSLCFSVHGAVTQPSVRPVRAGSRGPDTVLKTARGARRGDSLS